MAMQIMRKLGWVVVGVLALLLLACGVLYAMFDGDKIKAEVSRVVLEQKQRKLVIAGTPKLSFWPNVGIELDGVTLSEQASDAQFLALQHARVAVAVMPLLSRQVEVRGLELTGLQATVIKRKDGSLSIADLLGEPSASAPTPDKPATPAKPLQLDVDSVRITDAQLTWRDELAGSTTALSHLNVSSGRIQFSAADQRASVDALHVATNGSTGADAFELSLDAPQLAWSPQQSSAGTVTLSAALRGAARQAQLKLELSGLQGSADALQAKSMALTLDAKAADASVKAQLQSPVAVNLAGRSVELKQLAGTVELAHPSMPMKQVRLPITGTLGLNAQAQSAQLTLATQLDDSHIKTAVRVSKFAPLALGFDLDVDVDVDALNVDKYFPPQPKTGPTASTPTTPAQPESPFDFSALRGPQVQGNVRIGALQVAGLKLSQLTAKLMLAGGKLDIAPLAAQLYDGTARGSVSVNANGNALAVQQTLAGVNINPLMKDLLQKDMLEGRGTVVVDISTRGNTVSAMKKALAGSASLSLKDGAIKGINLAQSLRDIKAKLGQADTTQAANANQKTDFSELTASFKLSNGVAHNEDLSMKSPFIRLTGAGDIDVGMGQMNYLAKAAVVASGEGQGGQDLGQLKGLTVPVRVSGPLAQLSYKLEWGAMLEDATKAKVEEKKQEIKNQVQEKAKDLLKGIFNP
jgi:AsmA protein